MSGKNPGSCVDIHIAHCFAYVTWLEYPCMHAAYTRTEWCGMELSIFLT